MADLLCSVEHALVRLPGPGGAVPVLQDLSCSFRQGEHTVIIGGNGAGKSTLLRVLAGDAWIDAGSVSWFTDEGEEHSRIAGRAVASLISPAVQQYFQLHAWDITGRELMLSGFDGTAMLYSEPDAERVRQVEAMAAQLEATDLLEKKVPSMSQGQLRLVLLGRAMVRRPKLLLLDEYADGLDARYREVLERALERVIRQSTVVMTTHRADSIPDWCTRRLYMAEGRLSRQPAVQAEGGDRPAVVFAPASVTRGKPIISVQGDVYIQRELVLRDLDWQLCPGERWVLGGDNGSGKSTFLRLLAGDEIVAWPGHIDIDLPGWDAKDIKLEHVRRRIRLVSDLSQATYEYDITCRELVLSGFDNTVGVYREFSETEQAEAQRLLAVVGMEAYAEKSIACLSTGQARKLFLARALAGHPAVLLLDEPCSGLDNQARDDYLAALDGAAAAGMQYVFVSHYGEDIPRSANRKAVMRDGRMIITD